VEAVPLNSPRLLIWLSDAGASLHAANQPHQHARIQRMKREAQPHFEFEFNVNKCLRLVSHEFHAFV
jgi:hypothetical protein